MTNVEVIIKCLVIIIILVIFITAATAQLHCNYLIFRLPRLSQSWQDKLRPNNSSPR